MYFWVGAVAYPLIELAYRRRTHPSMALAGGMAAAVLGRISKTDRPLWQQALLGGLMITGIEYGIGKIFNRHYRIWDYRKMPLNVQGQICLPFTLVWCGLSAAAIVLFAAVKPSLVRETDSAFLRLGRCATGACWFTGCRRAGKWLHRP